MASKTIFLFMLSFVILTLIEGEIVNQNNSSAFDFIRNLQGCCQKGSTVQGLHQLKLYLARFGYLSYVPAQYKPNANSATQSFDDELESALKRYQSFYHLNTTGTLDGPTVSRMVMPRCGHADIKSHQQMHSKTLHTVSHFQFTPDSPKWPIDKSNLSYAFGFNYSDAYVHPVVRAFNTWAAASGYFTFYRVYNISIADIKISFERGDHGDGGAFDGPYGILAHAFYPPDGRMHYDVAETWSVGPSPVPDTIDLQMVALNEIGHLLGMGHSEDENAIMWSTLPSGSLKSLNADDILGVKALYGLKKLVT